jgi:hypothetical protein
LAASASPGVPLVCLDAFVDDLADLVFVSAVFLCFGILKAPLGESLWTVVHGMHAIV